MMAGQYAPSASRARVTLDQIAKWIQQHPEHVGVYAFHAARMIEREGLAYQLTFERCLRAATDAGLSQRTARTRVFHGFAAAAAGHIEPPTELEEGNG